MSEKAQFQWNMAFNAISALAAALALILVLWRVPRWVAKMEDSVEDLRLMIVHNTEDDQEHHTDKVIHMPFEEKIKVFVTRQEWDRNTLNIERQLSEIKAATLEIQRDVKQLGRE